MSEKIDYIQEGLKSAYRTPARLEVIKTTREFFGVEMANHVAQLVDEDKIDPIEMLGKLYSDEDPDEHEGKEKGNEDKQ